MEACGAVVFVFGGVSGIKDIYLVGGITATDESPAPLLASSEGVAAWMLAGWQTDGRPGKIDLFSGAAIAYSGIIEWAQYLKSGQPPFAIRTPNDSRSINFYNLNDMLASFFKNHNTRGSDYYNIFSKKYRSGNYNFDVRIPGADGIGDIAKYSLYYVTNITARIHGNHTIMTLYFEGRRSSLNGQVTTVMAVTLYGNMDSFNIVGRSIFTEHQ